MEIDKPTIASELIIEATEMKGKRPSLLNFKELIAVVESDVKSFYCDLDKKFTECRYHFESSTGCLTCDHYKQYSHLSKT